MQLERVLKTIAKERQKLITTFETEHSLFSGIDDLDQLLCGFKHGKSYTFVARPNNGMTAFLKTIQDNIDLLYQWNNTTVYSLINLPHSISYNLTTNQNPLFIIIDTNEFNVIDLKHLKTKTQNFKNNKTTIIFIYVLKDNIAKPITLNDIPNTLRTTSNTIISLFRPEHYNIGHWNDGTPTKHQLECTLIKDENTASKSIKLCIDDKHNRVQSCYDHSPFLQNLTTRIKSYLDE
jgi:hypothetical protein